MDGAPSPQAMGSAGGYNVFVAKLLPLGDASGAGGRETPRSNKQPPSR